MQPFELTRAGAPEEAVRLAAAAGTAQQGARVRFLAGGTNLVDLMKLEVERPEQLVDIRRLGLDRVSGQPDGGLAIGATARNSDLAHHPLVRERYPVLSEALLAGASGQLRNMATVGGNLLQRTRCVYFRDTAMACNKREPGTGCSAIGGYNRNLAILGTSEHCIASNPSDMNVALTALDATVHTLAPDGARAIPIAALYRPPGDTPHIETVLAPGELITEVRLPAPAPGERGMYVKLRDRASYEFALASAAVLLVMDGDRLRQVRVALGGVGTTPWRASAAEALLEGEPADRMRFHAAADAVLADAAPQPGNAFKLELVRRCLVYALVQLTGSP